MRSIRLFSTARIVHKASRRGITITLLMPLFFFFISPAIAQWQKVNVPTTSNLRGLSAVSADVVWASGSGGTVIRTTDGGKTWSVMIVPGADQLDFRGIRAFDQKNAIIISSGPAEKGQAKIYRTINGGEDWQQVFEEKRTGIFLDAVAFWDRNHGIVLSDPVDGKFALFVTDDGGLTWKQLPPAALAPALPKEGAFAASNSCLTVQGLKDVWFATGGAEVARVFHSADRGKTWTVAETPLHPANSSSGIFSLAFLDLKNGMAVGGDYAHPDSSNLPNVIRTGDGGSTWAADKPTNPPGVYLSSVSVLTGPDAGVFIAVGPKGAFMLPGTRPKWGNLELNSVAIANIPRRAIWAIGPRGSVALLKATKVLTEK